MAIVNQHDSPMHGNTLSSVSSLHLPCLGMLKVFAAKGNVDMNDAAAAETRSVSYVWEGRGGSLHSQLQGCSRVSNLNRAGAWAHLCLVGCGIKLLPHFLVLFWPVPLSRWHMGTFRSSMCQRVPAASRDPCLRGGIYTCRHMEVNYVVPLLCMVDVATKARLYLMPGKTCLKFLVWIDSHIFLLRRTFNSNASM